MFRVDLITLFAAFGAIQGILFSLILWFRNKSKQADKIFALLLFATSIRIAKNIVVHIRQIDPDIQMSPEIWRLLVNIGITHQFAIGPLFLLFFLIRTNDKFRFTKGYLWHFAPYALMMAYSPFQEWASWASWGLWLSYISILAYFVGATWVFVKALKTEGFNEGLKWLRNLLIICGLLLLAYSPALFKYIGYIGGAVLYALGIYFVSALVLGKGRFFAFFQHRYPGSSIKSAQSETLKRQLEQVVIHDSRYLDSNLSLSKLAKELGISPNALSQLINTEHQRSFTDYINQHRIEKAKALLSDPLHRKTKIVAIAFECGFNGLSTFNTVFKKMVGTPPNQFRKENNPE